MNPVFTDKFVAFVDICGFKAMVKAAEAGGKPALADILKLVSELGSQADRETFVEYGPTICPAAPVKQRDLDFQVTQLSDCVVVSAEISPAGVINLIDYCRRAAFKLLKRGVMCRGYVTRGPIYHTKDQIIGTVFSDAMEKEKRVAIFQQHADERGTPFIEIDKAVTQYVQGTGDKCVKDLYLRMVRTDGDLAAVFPFHTLSPLLTVGGFGSTFDAAREKESIATVRNWIAAMKARVSQGVMGADASAMRKGDQYLRMLDAQLAICDETDRDIDMFSMPFPRRMWPPQQ